MTTNGTVRVPWNFSCTRSACSMARAGSCREGFSGPGADWLDRYKPYINDGKTVVTSPRKRYGPESNDLVLQLRKAGISRVILAGMSANLCAESHRRERRP